MLHWKRIEDGGFKYNKTYLIIADGKIKTATVKHLTEIYRTWEMGYQFADENMAPIDTSSISHFAEFNLPTGVQLG